MPRSRARLMTAGSTFGVTQQLGPCGVQPIDIFHGQYRAGTDQAVSRRHLGGDLDRAEGLRRVQRDFDRRQAGIDQRADDISRLFGLTPRRMAMSGRFMGREGDAGRHQLFLSSFGQIAFAAAESPRRTAASASTVV